MSRRIWILLTITLVLGISLVALASIGWRENKKQEATIAEQEKIIENFHFEIEAQARLIKAQQSSIDELISLAERLNSQLEYDERSLER
ncbi:MAG: hypothetical protein U9Q67_02030 [Patescibacteria group bacterium]|nr:hypothetical protein [Patescibacteria group bacterium]